MKSWSQFTSVWSSWIMIQLEEEPSVAKSVCKSNPRGIHILQTEDELLLLVRYRNQVSLFDDKGELLRRIRFLPSWRLHCYTIDEASDVLISYLTSHDTRTGIISFISCGWYKFIIFILPIVSPDLIGVLFIAGEKIGRMKIINLANAATITEISEDTNAVRAVGLPQQKPIRSSIAEALADVESIFYEQESMEIITGTAKGQIHVWGT